MGRADATLGEIMQAAKQAHLHDVIQTLPQGYDTSIGERGTRLSGGQVQRLALARAFVRNASILLLDEATSTLDPDSEAQVLQAIDTEISDHIVLVIAHRLNTIKTADQIIVLKEGQIVAMGTHQTLLHTSEAYQELVKAYADEEILV